VKAIVIILAAAIGLASVNAAVVIGALSAGLPLLPAMALAAAATWGAWRMARTAS
jgi:hypothetical protein